MKKILFSSAFIIIISYSQCDAKQSSVAPDATGMRNLTAFELTKAMVPGWNIGNTLEARPTETSWGNPKISQQLIDSISAAGFRSVRIPVAWSSHFSDAVTFTIDPLFLQRVEEVVNYVIKSGMYAIINIHWDGGWMQPTYAEQTAVNDRLNIMWSQIASHFINYNDSLLFAGTNEVMKEGDYNAPSEEYYTVQNSFNQTFVTAVRSTGGKNAYRYLVVQGFNTNIDYTISYFTMPEDVVSNKLLVEVHYYDPYNFTINSSNHNIIEWGTDAEDPSKAESWANESYADGQFETMKEKFYNNGVAVILGEYCAMARTDLGSAELNAIHAKYRLYYNKYITKSIIQHGLIPYYWDSGFTGNDASGIFNRANGSKAYPEIIKALTDTSYKIPEGPNSIGKSIINSFYIFPNPAKDFINFQIKNFNYSENKILNFYNIAGVNIKSIEINTSENRISILDLPTGFYLINYNNRETGRFIKE